LARWRADIATLIIEAKASVADEMEPLRAEVSRLQQENAELRQLVKEYRD
jgi:hypothetical protein